jgi:mannose-6-phosphate isomerase-like protein (cupin superfamily)
MPKKINAPTLVKAEGTKLKIIEEFIGRVNTGTTDLSIAKMKSPQGWEEPGQQPAFDEYTVVLKGTLLVETRTEEIYVSQGQAIITYKDEWVRYSSPLEGGAEYIAVCLPAFSPDTVNRDTVG